MGAWYHLQESPLKAVVKQQGEYRFPHLQVSFLSFFCASQRTHYAGKTSFYMIMCSLRTVLTNVNLGELTETVLKCISHLFL